MKFTHPLLISCKDIQRITGKHYRTCKRIMSAIKAANQKSSSDYITFSELCDHLKIKPDEAKIFLQ